MRSYITVCALAFAASVSAAPLGEASSKGSSSKDFGSEKPNNVKIDETKAGGPLGNAGNEAVINDFLKDVNVDVLTIADRLRIQNALNNLLAGNNVNLNVLGIQKGNEQSTTVVNSDSGKQTNLDRRQDPFAILTGLVGGKKDEEKDDKEFKGEDFEEEGEDLEDLDFEEEKEEKEFHGEPEFEQEQEQEHKYTSSGYGSSNHGGKPYDTIIVKPTPSGYQAEAPHGGAGNGAQDPSHGAHGAGYGSQSAEAMSHGGQGAGFGGQGGQGMPHGGQDPSAHAAQQGGAGQGFGQGGASYGQQQGGAHGAQGSSQGGQGGAHGAGSHGMPVGTESFDSSKGGY